jgi:hypothetical protein
LQALGAYSDLLGQAQGVAAIPYVPYTGELVAPVNPQESLGIGNVNAAAQFSLPSTMEGLNLASSAAQPITSGQIQQYESPYTQQVVNATQNQFNNQNAQQMEGVKGNAIAQGAMGGNREAIAEAETANQQQLAQAPVIAGLENTGYQTGLNTALTEQQAQLMGGYGVAGIGASGQNALLSGAGQQIGAGQLQQTTQQAQDTANYQQYLNALAYPFQTNQWLAGIEGSIGPQMGGSGTAQTTGPAPSLLSQIGGLGTLAGGLFGSSGAVGGLSSLAGMLPFRRGGGVRAHDLEGVAKRDMGGGMEGYSFGYPMTGVAGGIQNAPAAPYGHPGGSSYVPASQLSPAYPFSWRLPNPPSLPNNNTNPSATGHGVAQLAQGIFGKMNGVNTNDVDPSLGDNNSDEPSISSSYPLGPIYRRGGGVRSRDVGGPIGNGGELGELLPPPIDLSGGSSDPTAGAVSASQPDTSVPLSQPRSAMDVPLPRSRPPGLGVAAPPMDLASYTAPEPGGDYGQNDISRWQRSIGAIESGNNYTKLGPVTQTGDRAYGRYGIMGNNVPQWTQQVLGQSMTPQQFLASPEAQDAVFRSKFGDYMNKYGPEGAGRAWYAGERGMNNLNATAHDANGNPIGVTVADYGQRFLRGLGIPVGDIQNSTALPVNSQPTQGLTPSRGPDQSGQGVAGGQSFLQKLFPNVDFSANSKLWPAMIAAGAGMMSSRSPFPGVAIGEGATAGLNEYQYEKSAEQAGAIKQTELQQNAQKLQREADQFGLNYQISLQKLQMEQRKEAMDEMKPIQVGQGPFGPIYAVRDPKAGGYRIIDPETGQPGQTIGQSPNSQGNLPSGVSGSGAKTTPGLNPIGGTAPGVTIIPDSNTPAPGSRPPAATPPPGLQSSAIQPPELQPAVYNPDKLAPPSVTDTGNGSFDDASSAARNILKTDISSTEGLDQDVLARMKADPFFQKNPGALSRAIQIAKGLAPIPSTTNRSYQNQYLVNKAYELNPNLVAAEFPMRQRALNFFAVGTQGGGGQQIISFNRWLSHAGRLMSLAEQLNMGPNVTWNTMKNMLAKSGYGQTLGLTDSQTQDLIGQIETNGKGVAAEAAKVLAGAHPGEMERQQWEKAFSPDTPLSVMRGKIDELMNMGRDAMDANIGQYNLDMGTNHTGDQFLTPRAQTIMRAMDRGANMTDTIKQLDAGKTSSLRPVDQQALQWANTHPNDPKAAQIKRGLGLQ